jgi:hypothetical protein
VTTAPTGSADGAADLRQLRLRLGGGIAGAIAGSRGPRGRVADEEALTLPGVAAQLRRLGESAQDARGHFGEPLDGFGGFLAGNRPLLLSLLYSPELAVERMAALRGMPAADGVDVWTGLCWCADSAWRCLHTAAARPDRLAQADREMLRPLAARLRFLVLSEPFRRRPAVPPWSPAGADVEIGPVGRVGAVFGSDSWAELVGACRQARWEWQACLNGFESHPLIAQAAPAGLEAELAALIFRDGRPGEPLVISGRPLNETASWTSDDQAVVADALERHLLPRFMMRPAICLAARAAAPAPGGGWTARVPRRGIAALGRVVRRVPGSLPCVALLATAATGAAAVVAAAFGDFGAGAWLAVAGYALAGAGTVAFGPLWAAPWLLRLPAASAVGLLVLVTLAADWWQRPRLGATACVALTAASAGYLLIEVRNHGVSGTAVLGRGLLVACIGAVHALLVALIGLVLIAPAFMQSGGNPPARIDGLWRHQHAGHAWTVLALAACWCLAAGVFSQILWDDRPITAPLAHLQWRSGR